MIMCFCSILVSEGCTNFNATFDEQKCSTESLILFQFTLYLRKQRHTWRAELRKPFSEHAKGKKKKDFRGSCYRLQNQIITYIR